MAGYQVDFGALQTAATNLQATLEQLQAQMKELDSIKTSMLSDSTWKGPNKSKFVTTFEQYQSSLNELYSNANLHLEKLQESIKTYASAENS
jgi:WXG100 family type VII secretion target